MLPENMVAGYEQQQLQQLLLVPLTSFVVVALVLPAEVDEERAEEILEH